MPQKITRTYTTSRDAVTKHRKVVQKCGSYPSRETAERRFWIETSTVEIAIDVDALCKHIAARAIGSRVGRSRLLGGIVKAKVTKRVEGAARVEAVPLRDGYEIVEG